MIAAIYLRCSHEEQSTDGYSITAQLSEINAYCVKNNVQIHKIYKDEGISGTKEDRPEFQCMIRDAEKGLFNIILVHKFDRFARRIELSQKIKNQLKKANVNVISITEPIEDSPIGFFQEGLLELLAEYYVRNLSKEVKKGQIQRASEGWHNGVLPYGYRRSGKFDVYIVEEEAKVIQKIYEMYLNEGFGYGRIARFLNDSNIPTYTGKKWSHFQVDRILQNVKYAGWIYHSGKTYDSNLPRIIDRDTFVAVQSLRTSKDNKSFGYRGSNYNKILLAGFIRCGECGSSFRSVLWKNSLSYMCNYSVRYLNDGKCTFTKQFHGRKLETEIINFVRKVAKNKKTKIITTPKIEINDILDNRRENILKQLERAKKAYLDGVFELKEYQDTKKKLEAELAQIKTVPVQDNNAEVRSKIAHVMEEYDSYPIEDIKNRKACLRSIIDEIIVFKDRIQVVFKN